MHDDSSISERRAWRLLDERIRPAVFEPLAPLALRAAAVGGEPVGFDEAMRLVYEPVDVGARWGRPWDTTWFHVRATLPAGDPTGALEAVLDLGFNPLLTGFQAEALVWSPEGVPLHGLHPRRRWHRVDPRRVVDGRYELFVEAASNPVIPSSPAKDIPDVPLYRVARADIGRRHEDVWLLELAFDAALRLTLGLPSGSDRRRRLTAALDRAMDSLDPGDVAGTAAAARRVLAPALAAPGAPGRHRLVAVGHAHIDTAWLWPLRETVRKCARTFANQLEMLRDHPEHRFACSQAQQYAWMEERYPTVFEGIRAAVADGRWLPVGGMWVEADANLPGGEALARQFLHGQRYFRSRFGVTCGEVWIPDVFGYPASLPQIMRLAGATRFVTQKLSWNRTNRFPHHTFVWEGIDGSSILAHFPPVETYNSELTPEELLRAEHGFADHALSRWSLVPFGHGDGGGGPTREMLGRAGIVADTEGLPALAIGTVDDFFRAVEAEVAADPSWPRWRGELYFEMHRGTYTSQARTKAGNRRCEALLREAEWWSLAAFGATADGGYPHEALDRMWREVLTLQFHDILPGSSIGRVHAEAEDRYHAIEGELHHLVDTALARLVPAGPAPALANPSPFPRPGVHEVPHRPGTHPHPHLPDAQPLHDGGYAVWADLPAGGVAAVTPAPPGASVVVDLEQRVMANGVVALSWDDDGLITSIVHEPTGREVLRTGHRANVLEVSDDLPVEYDAWDLERYHARRRRALTAADSVEVVDSGPLVARLRVTRHDGPSRFVQTVELRAASPLVIVHNDIDWHHDEHVLKVAFPVDVDTDRIACEIQFGHVVRPTHTNTSWDHARFEICAHRWVDLAEPGFGVALLNDAKYGHDVLDGVLRLTLLRAPDYPAPGADRGRHRFAYALLPHGGHGPGDGGVVAEGYHLGNPVRVVDADPARLGEIGAAPARSSNPAVVVEAVKPAADGSGDLVVRLYEAWGTRAATIVSVDSRLVAPGARPSVCDLLEEPIDADDDRRRGVWVRDGAGDDVEVTLRPFTVATLRWPGRR